jgi:hypothetical protein
MPPHRVKVVDSPKEKKGKKNIKEKSPKALEEHQ